MKTGLESLNTGASDITYSGNEGPKSPQQIAEFELMEYMEEFERVFPEMKPLRGTEEYMQSLNEYFQGLAKQEIGGGIQMASATDPMLEEEYDKYVFEMEEMGQEPMSLEQFRQEAMSGMAMGGRAGYASGQLVKPSRHGVRPGYRGDAAYRSDSAQSKSIGQTGSGKAPSTASERGDGLSSRQKAILASETIKQQNQLGPSNRDVAMGIGGKQQTGTVTDAAKLGLSGGVDRTAVGPGSKYQANRTAALNLAGSTYKPKTTPFGLLNILQQTLGSFGFDKAKAFFAKNVAGNYGYGYGEKDFEQYMEDRRSGLVGAYGNVEQGQNALSGRGGNTTILPEYSMMGGGADMGSVATTTPTADDFVFNFAQPGRKLTEEDLERVAAIGAADGGRIGYAGGGIADLRQGYFLGKLVKKAVRGIKKVAKSPLGRAALLYAGGTYLGGLKGLSGAKTNMSFLDSLRTPSNLRNLFNIKNLIPTGEGEDGNFTGKIFDKLLRDKGDDYESFDPFKIGILGASALTGLMAKRDQDDEVSLDEYMRTASRGPDIDPRGIREYIAANKGNINPIDYAFLNPAYYQTAADGGRIGLANGLTPRQAALKALPEYKTFNEDEEQELSLGGSAGLPPITQETQGLYSQSFSDDETPMPTQPDQMPRPKTMMNPMMARQMNPMMGRQMNPMMGGRMMAQEGGLMDMGGMEKDYRNEGGFVPIGGQERADDVPARLSKNEFVFTADAVRNAGGGDIDKGAEIMENMMENLEAGGEVSEESQGLEGARAMFATQQRLGEVL